jgi:hypothetical protein
MATMVPLYGYFVSQEDGDNLGDGTFFCCLCWSLYEIDTEFDDEWDMINHIWDAHTDDVKNYEGYG